MKISQITPYTPAKTQNSRPAFKATFNVHRSVLDYVLQDAMARHVDWHGPAKQWGEMINKLQASLSTKKPNNAYVTLAMSGEKTDVRLYSGLDNVRNFLMKDIGDIKQDNIFKAISDGADQMLDSLKDVFPMFVR